jgi:hypothetical protein
VAVHNLVQSYEAACSKKRSGDFDDVIKDAGDENSRWFKSIFSKRNIEDCTRSTPHISYITFVYELVILGFAFHNLEITVKHKQISPTFTGIRKNLPKYDDVLGCHRCADEDSSVLRCYVMSDWYIDTDVLREDFGLFFRIK